MWVPQESAPAELMESIRAYRVGGGEQQHSRGHTTAGTQTD